MSTELATKQIDTAAVLERVIVAGDLSKLTPQDRLQYYEATCRSLGLNPLTKPFEYISLNGKLTLYARKDCTDQLRNVHGVSLTIPARELVDGIYVVTGRATKPDGRTDESIGAVPLEGLKGEAKSNAMMKAETKAKRRVTLSICGLGMLDESEIETIPDARPHVEQTPAGNNEPEWVTKPHAKPVVQQSFAPETPSPLVAMIAKLRTPKKFEVFDELLLQLTEVFGEFDGNDAYSEILKKHGADSYRDFKTLKPAEACVKALYEYIENGKIEKAKRDEVTLEDVPV